MKKIIAIIVVILVLVAIPISVYLVSQQQEIRKRAAPTAVVSLIPATSSRIANEEFDMQINLETGENDLRGADLSINFDPAYLEVVDADQAVTGVQVTPGTILPNAMILANQANNTTGIILLSIGTVNSYRGEGIFGKIKFKAKVAVSSTTVSFDNSATRLIAVNDENILGTQNSATVTITASDSDGETPTATPTPTTGAAAPAATATPTPTTGAAAPAATATPTPTTGAAAPAATATPTPTTAAGRGGGTTVTTQVTLTSITSGQTVTSTKPVFSGKAPAGATVTITVYSNPITGTTVANSSGVWSWTPTTELAPGSHSVTITATATGGTTSTATTTFTVGTLPQTGNTSLTILLLFSGLLIILPVLWMLLKKSPSQA